MEIILKQDVQGLGRALDLVKVKNGFALNYLFPQGLAVMASLRAKQNIEAERAKLAERYEADKKEAQIRADKLKDFSVTLSARVSEGDKLYGSIQAADVSAKLKEAGYDIDKRNVILPDTIKQLGMFTIKVQLHRDVEAKIKLWVINDESAA